jgi:hypothetical protein
MEKPIRVQRSRKKGSKLPPNTVCVTRGTKYGNPFKVVKLGYEWGIYPFHPEYHRLYNTKREATLASIELYKKSLLNYTHGGSTKDMIIDLAVIESIQNDLKGKNLACFCKLDEPCHADFLLKIANL